MGPIGVQEMILIFVIALLLFGPKKLPELGRILGKGLTEFRRAKNELKSTFETHLRELEREANVDAALKNANSTFPYSTPYSNKTYDESGSYDYSSPTSFSPSEPPVSSPSSIASATATQDAQANQEAPAITATPVAGTVPRTGSSPVPEGHSA